MKSIENISLILSSLTLGLIMLNLPLIQIEFYFVSIHISTLIGIGLLMFTSFQLGRQISTLVRKLDKPYRRHAISFILSSFLITFWLTLWLAFDNFNLLSDFSKLILILFSFFFFYGLYHGVASLVYILFKYKTKGFELVLKTLGVLGSIGSLVISFFNF